MKIFRKVIQFLYMILLVSSVGCGTEKSEDLPEHLDTIENLTVYPANPTPDGDIELIREVSFGETDEVFFGRMVENFAVDSKGRVFIADQIESRIHIFDSDSSYLQSIGRGGRGPGEFQMIWDLEINNEKIHVLDYQRFMISVFDVNTFDHIGDYDTHLRNNQDNPPSWIQWTREKRLSYRPTSIFVRADSTYLLLFSDEAVGSGENVAGRTYEVSLFDPQSGGYKEHDLLSFDWTGQILFHEENGGTLVMSDVPYKRSSLFDFSNDQFVHGWSEELLFRFYDENGEYQRAFYIPYSNLNLHIDDVLSHYEGAPQRIFNAIRGDDLPETWPAFNSLVLDDENRLWISTISDDQANYEWWVLDETGVLLATFSWPRNRDLKEVKNGYVYTMERDRKTEQQEVVRYEINIEM